MTDPAYPVARTAAVRLHEHFVREIAAAQEGGAAPIVPAPGPQAIEAMINAAFWASLRREEGYVPKISLVWLPPAHASPPLRFERPLPLAAASLVRVAPAVERPGIHLGVWGDERELYVWGTSRAIPMSALVLEVIAPGLLVIKHRRGVESGKFVNVAVLEGEQIKVLSERMSSLSPDCPAVVPALLGFATPGAVVNGVDVLVQIAVSMRAHGRGGALLVVPTGSASWKESIVSPVLYAVSPPYTELKELVEGHRGKAAAPRDTLEHQLWNDAVNEAIDAIAGLTAVDGATVVTDHYDLLAFGAKIHRRDGLPRVEQVIVTEPIEGGAPTIADPAQLGGTRHLSAAQFVRDQQDAVALVASQDGRFTIFAWSPCENAVHAHRVEALLL
jgi:hypothetical protein